MVEVAPFRYRAFLSYSHRDTAWGKWLHGFLEGYRIDKDLVGRETPVGRVPKTLRPIFRDREDFSAGHSLTDQTRLALESSEFLIVICSPHAARSVYVNEEIRRYKALGRGDRVIPIIVDGEPGDPERECFPPAVRFKVGADGTLTDEREEPIAADARPQGDGKEIAKLKLVAGLLGIGLDEIVRRAERARRQRLRNWIGALTALLVIFASLAIWAEHQRRNAVISLNAATKTSNDLIFDLAMRFRHQTGVPSALVRDILARAQKLQEELTASGQTSYALQHSQASVLSESALTLQSVGERSSAFDSADRARTILEKLVSENPRDTSLQMDLGVAYSRIADSLASAGQLKQAIAALEKARSIHQTVADVEPSNSRNRHNLAVDYVKIGDALSREGRRGEALTAYQQNLAIMNALVQSDKLNANWWRDLGSAHERIGDVRVRLEQSAEALSSYRAALSIAQALADADKDNTFYQRNLSVAHDKIGNTLMALDRPDQAIEEFRKALDIRQKLVAGDRANANWLRDLAVSNNLVAGALARQNKFEEALAAYQAGLALGKDLVAQDKNNIFEWKVDLFTDHILIGRLLARHGKRDDALRSYREGVAIAAAQAKARPDNAIWRDHLRRGVTQIGILSYNHILAREFDAALKTADEAISYTPDMIWLYSNRAHALMFLGRAEEAKALYLQYRGHKNVRNKDSWEEFIVEEFEGMRKIGLAHPLIDEIEKLLSTPR